MKGVLFFCFTAVMALIIIITGCGSILNFNSNNMATPEYVEVTNIILIPDELTLAAGESEQLIADFVPPHTTETSLLWTSSNENIVGITSHGRITGIATGSVMIKAESLINTNIQDTLKVTVYSTSTTTFTVNFQSNGGTSVPAQYIGYGSHITAPVIPIRDGFQFDGWFSDIELINDWDFANDVIAEDITLYAKWHEVFMNADKPTFEIQPYIDDPSKTYALMKPWNYEKAHNSERQYPIVIALHGAISLTDYYYSPFIVDDEEEMIKYPCFFLSPNNTNLGWDIEATWVRNIIESLIQNERIDQSRIYIVGFSMGGSGAYYFSERLYLEKNLIVAGIIRSAGRSNYDLPDEIAEKISIWYHVGLSDSSNIQNIAQLSYDFMKNHPGNDSEQESTINGAVAGYNCEINTLTRNNVDFMKLSKYSGLGHADYPVRNDPSILTWLFSQSLDNR